MSRKDKLKKVKEQRKEAAPTHNLSALQLRLDRGEELEKAALELKEALQQGVDFNDLDKLLAQLASISEVREAVEGLREAVKDFPALPEEVKIKGFNDFVEALKEIKIEAPAVEVPAPIVKLEKDKSTNKILEQIAMAMASFAVAIKASAPSAPSQRPADFVPYRRVIKDGNAYKFDDDPSGGAGGGVSGRGVPQATNASDQVFVPVANPDGSNISGGGGGGGASTVADGADIAEGATADAAVTAGNAGTVSGKLRQISADINSVKSNTANNATNTKQDTGNSSLSSIDGKLTDVATQTTLALIKAKTDNLDTALSGIKTGTDKIIAAPATAANQSTGNTSLGSIDTKLSDLSTRLSESDFDTKTGSLTETAPATDTASSGLNGRLQRIAQRLTSLIALVPAALSALGNFKTSLADIAGTAVDANSGTKSAGTQRVVIATDQPALTNKLLVTPDSVALPANQSVNQAQVAGAATDTNSGVKSAGTQRIVIATDQPALTNALLTTPGGGVADNGVDSGNPIKVGSRYNSSNQTYADGDRADLQGDINGFLRATLATQLSSAQDSVLAALSHSIAGANLALNAYSARISSNATTTPVSSTAYVSSIVICVETAGTTSTLDIRDKSGTPIYLVRTLSTAALLNNGDLTINFTTPVKMTSGIDVITAGAVAAVVGVFINYYQ